VTGRRVLKILDVSQTPSILSLEDGSDKEGIKEYSHIFPFNLEFPSTVAGGVHPLPPTFLSSFTTTEGWVRYFLHVHVIKTGLWPREM
jgi:hypothetical protein